MHLLAFAFNSGGGSGGEVRKMFSKDAVGNLQLYLFNIHSRRLRSSFNHSHHPLPAISNGITSVAEPAQHSTWVK